MRRINQRIMIQSHIMKSIGVFLIMSSLLVSNVTFAQSQEQYVPYTENENVEFTSGGRINYDLLIAKIMPEIFEEKFHDMGINVSKEDIVLERGFQILIYEPHSYNCGFTVNQEKTNVYWLEAAINSTHIQYVNIYEEIPRKDNSFAGFHGDCFSLIETKAAEIFLKEKSFFTEFEEKHAAALVKYHLRGNENLNNYPITVGKFNYDFGNKDNISICGEFIGLKIGSKYYSAVLDDTGTLHFSLEKNLSPLCEINEDSVHEIKFQNTPKDESLQSWKNFRQETVYLKPDSAENLLHRNYLYVDAIKNHVLHYATHLKLKAVDYQPENSTTILTVTPPGVDSYMMIRLNNDGVHYYMPYGTKDWHIGELSDVLISVNEKETEYSTSSYVKSPEAPYPRYYTNYVFEIPAESTKISVHLDIENYDYDSAESDKEWEDY